MTSSFTTFIIPFALSLLAVGRCSDSREIPDLSMDIQRPGSICTENDECGHNQQCLREGNLPGRCVCIEDSDFRQFRSYSDCIEKSDPAINVRVSCKTDEDCSRNEVCMSWTYDPTLESARMLRNRLTSGRDKPETHQFCIDAWVIYNKHLDELDEPRTGGGLRSSRRYFDTEEYFFSGRRPARSHQQYIGFGEDMMLILFLVCILATLFTVHRGACYRQIQDARRNTPLRHILPMPEDRPPPYTDRSPDSADGLTSIVCTSAPGPKPLTEAPPPTYEEALYRQAAAAANSNDAEMAASTSNETDDVNNVIEDVHTTLSSNNNFITVQSAEENTNVQSPVQEDNIISHHDTVDSGVGQHLQLRSRSQSVESQEASGGGNHEAGVVGAEASENLKETNAVVCVNIKHCEESSTENHDDISSTTNVNA